MKCQPACIQHFLQGAFTALAVLAVVSAGIPASLRAETTNSASAPSVQHRITAARISRNLELMIRYFGMTAEQTAGVKGILDAQAEWESEWHDRLDAARDGAAREKNVRARDALYDERRAKRAEVEKRARALLSAKQVADWDGFAIYASLSARLSEAHFTPEQDAAVRRICVESGAVYTSTNDSARLGVYNACTTRIRKDVLTPEQRAAVDAATLRSLVMVRLAGIRLDAEQAGKISDLAAMSAKELPEGAGFAELQRIRDGLMVRIRDDILTTEQREALDSRRGRPAAGAEPRR